MRDTMRSLDNCIRMTQLRLATLSYIRLEPSLCSLQCFNQLIELRNLSQLAVKQLEELHHKWLQYPETSLDYQIASQQLIYFATELHENLNPRTNDTFEVASKLSDGLPIIDHHANIPEQAVNRSPKDAQVVDLPSGDTRARDALVRLKHSMNENENLIATIASNVEHTRGTIDKIYDSLQSTSAGLSGSQKNAIEAVKQIRGNTLCKSVIYTIFIVLCVAVIFYLIKFTWNVF